MDMNSLYSKNSYPEFLDNFFSKFSQLFQLSFGFALGLAFAQTNITVGWLIVWIFAYEFIFYVLTIGTKYYDLLFRLSFNCLFIIAVFWGQYIYYGTTTFEHFLYPSERTDINIKKYNKSGIMQKLDTLFTPTLEQEEIKIKKNKLRQKFRRIR
jgi:hypothetical protein